MKLCKLLHEAMGRCPKCGGPIDQQGRSRKYSSQEMIFPDKRGIWTDPVTGEMIDFSDDPSFSEPPRQ